MADQIPLKLVTSPSNLLARMVSIDGGGTDTLPASLVLREASATAGVPVGTTQTQTLTNKTLTAPRVDYLGETTTGNKVVELFNNGTAVNFLTIANAPTTLNPTIQFTGSDATVNGRIICKGAAGVVKIQAGGVLDEAVNLTGSQTLTNKTLTLPTIANFANAQHAHDIRDVGNTSGGALDARFCFTPGFGAATLYSSDIAASTTITGAVAGVQQIATAVPFIVANSLAVRSAYRVTCGGKYTTAGAARTVIFRLSVNGTDHYFSTAAITLGNTVTDNRYQLVMMIQCVTTGTIGFGSTRSFLVNGYVEGSTAPAPAPVIATAPVSLATFDTEVDNDIRLLATIAGGGAGDTLTNDCFFVEKLN